MKLYRISGWSEQFENNRSRTVKDLAWVAIPNRHDGENYTAVITSKDGAEIFSAWVLMVQVASRCQPRGTLLRGNRTPHDSASLAIKTRAPKSWFDKALKFLIENTDWLEIEELAEGCQEPDSRLTPSRQSGDEEQKGTEQKGTEGEGMACAPAASGLVKDIFDSWNAMAQSSGLPQCLLISDKRRRTLEIRLREPFFESKWREALEKVGASKFCKGESDRGWRATFDWFIQPDSVTKIMEGKYDTGHIKANQRPNQRNLGICKPSTGGDYGEAAKRKLERQALEAKHREASEAQGNGTGSGPFLHGDVGASAGRQAAGSGG